MSFATFDNSWPLVVGDLATSTASSLQGLDNIHGLRIGNLAEDDVPVIEPFRLSRGDEELGTVAIRTEC